MGVYIFLAKTYPRICLLTQAGPNGAPPLRHASRATIPGRATGLARPSDPCEGEAKAVALPVPSPPRGEDSLAQQDR
jgi:hypothetical protein